MNEVNDDPMSPDPRLGAALRWVAGDAPMEEVDWSALRGAIRDRSELPIARLRARRRRARWTRPLIPLAAAAGIGAVALLGGRLGLQPDPAPVRTAAAAPAVSPEEVLTSNLPDEEFRLLVTSRSDPDDLLRMALDER
jgi:hypothetical protein